MKKIEVKKYLVFFVLAGFCLNGSGQTKVDSLFEDIRFRNDTAWFFTTKTVDFIRVKSTVSEGVEFAVVIYKPEKPSPILLLSHGWHQSVMPPSRESGNPYPGFLSVSTKNPLGIWNWKTSGPDIIGKE